MNSFWQVLIAGGIILGLIYAAGAVPPSESPELSRQAAAARQVQAAMNQALPISEPAQAESQTEPESQHGQGWIIGWLAGALLIGAGAWWWLTKIGRNVPTVSGTDRIQAIAEQVRSQFQGQVPPAAGAENRIITANPKFLDRVVEDRLLTAAELAGLRGRFKDNAFAILLSLAAQHPHRKQDLGQWWADSVGVAYVNPAETLVQQDLLQHFPKDLLTQRLVMPLYEIDNIITCATATPGDQVLVKQLENASSKFISPVFAFPDQILSALAISWVSAPALASMISGKAGGKSARSEQELSEQDLKQWIADNAITNFARGLLLLALQRRASDIHIEPRDEDILIRFRQDGLLQEVLHLDPALLPSIVNVLKILAGADIGERRRPQDGHLTLTLPDRELDLRFSSVPTIYGEKVVMRLLGQNQFTSVPDLASLDYSKEVLDNINRIVSSPNGVFFVTGPTGSGKTTTLYAALKSLDSADINIMTIEDPVEYRLPGINQVQVNPLAGVSFATALRAFLRQDPDVVLVGEIRDLETAKIAAQAALTGHLVLTTMHTNNALQAITRLIQIGVEPFLVAPSIIGVMAQRLVRRLCPNCREKYALTPAEVAELFISDGQTPVHFYRAKGCAQCNFSGYSGRLGIYELFLVDDEMRDYIAHNATILDIQKYALAKGFTDMRYDGIKKVMRGLTTMNEVDQVVTTFE